MSAVTLASPSVEKRRAARAADVVGPRGAERIDERGQRAQPRARRKEVRDVGGICRSSSLPDRRRHGRPRRALRGTRPRRAQRTHTEPTCDRRTSSAVSRSPITQSATRSPARTVHTRPNVVSWRQSRACRDRAPTASGMSAHQPPPRRRTMRRPTPGPARIAQAMTRKNAPEQPSPRDRGVARATPATRRRSRTRARRRARWRTRNGSRARRRTACSWRASRAAERSRGRLRGDIESEFALADVRVDRDDPPLHAIAPGGELRQRRRAAPCRRRRRSADSRCPRAFRRRRARESR